MNQEPSLTFPIVGIGCSEEGWGALEAFFSALPATEVLNVAFVVVRCPSRQQSTLPLENLARCVNLPIREVTSDAPLEVNTIYLSPPGSSITLANGKFKVGGAEPLSRDGRYPVDHLFQALAQSHAQLACAVVLSGSGADSAAGVEAIKNQNGLVIAESLESAGSEGMPSAAIATGLVDFILPPCQMIPAITAYLKCSHELFARAQLKTFDEDVAMSEIFQLLRKECGQDFSQYKRGTVSRRLMRRMAVHQFTRLNDYLDFIRGNSAEVQALFRDFLIGVTKFFRDPAVFLSLEQKVIPELFQLSSQREGIRAWVTGCSTGEEAYSLAILLTEANDHDGKPIQILATDIDARAITVARGGLYPATIASELSEGRLSRFFSSEFGGKSFRVTRALRDLVIFSEHNLIKDPPFSRIDLISCRNLLIYLDAELQRKVIALFHHALKPGGILLLGPSENIGEASQLFAPIEGNLKIFRRIDRPAEGQLPSNFRYFPTHMPEHRARQVPEQRIVQPAPSPRTLTERAILQQFVPAAILVNELGDIAYIHGRVGQYLEPSPDSPGSNNVFKMAREGLRPVLHTLLRQVIAGASVAQASGVRVRTNGHHIRASVAIRPVDADAWLSHSNETKSTFYLISLHNSGEDDIVSPIAIADLSHEGELRIRSLLQELDAKEEQLQATRQALERSNQELIASNEELQSINEELQATNEELETSKEELQSVNEELFTVNSELQVKVVDLLNANNDILNLLSGTGIATIFLDLSLCIMRFTPSVTKIIKIIPSDTGRPVGDLVLNLKGYFSLEQDARQVLNGSELIIRDVQTLDGEWFSLRIQPYRTQDHRIGGVAITFSDITERKMMEDALKQSEQRLRDIFDQSPAGIAIVDSQTAAFRMVNPALASMTGYSEIELAELDWKQLTHPDDVQPDEERMAEMNAGKIPGFQLEKRYRHRDGHYFWVSITVAPMKVVDNSRPQHVLIVENITMRKMAEDELLESERKYRQMFDAMQEGVALHEIICDAKGRPCDYRWIDLNPAYEAMTGLKREAVLGKRVLEVLPQLESVWIEKYGHVAISGESISFEETSAEIKKSFSVSAYCPQMGQFAVLVRDTTRERESEMQLRAAKEAAENASKAKSQFLANMSHELRTPLNPIIGFSELLSIAPNLTHEQRHWLKLISDRGKDLLELISEVLDLARIEAGRMTTTAQRISLREFIANLTDTILLAVTQKGLEFAFDVDSAVPDSLSLDSSRLRQILLNLLGNAIKFTKQGKISLTVTAAPPSRLVRGPTANEVALLFRVTDSGIGIPDDKQQVIFEAFRQADEGHAAQFGGAGLGLSIASKLTTLMGGTIWVESKVGEGSHFSFTVVASVPEPEVDPAPSCHLASQSRKQFNILIVEDDNCSAMLAAEILKLRGDRYKVAEDGEKALAFIEQETFDAVLMDMRIPVLGGIEVTKILRERNNAVPIIGLTAHARDEDRRECLAAGMNAFLTKPVSVETVGEVIDKVLALER